MLTNYVSKITSMRINYGRNYVCIRSNFYGLRRLDSKYALQRLLWAVAGRLAVRYWNPRVLHGIPLGSSGSRRTLERSSISSTGLLASFGTLMAMVVLWGSVPNNAVASTIFASQTDNSSIPVLVAPTLTQGLGTGFSGSMSSYTYQYSLLTQQTDDRTYTVRFVQCDNSTLNPTDSCTNRANLMNDVLTIASTTGPGNFTVTNSTTTPFALSSSKYYFLEFFPGTCNGNCWNLKGSASNLYSGGAVNTTGFNSASPMVDIYFILYGNVSQPVSTFTINHPTYGQLLSTGISANFNYTYVVSGSIYDTAGFSLVDNTAGQSIDVSSLEEFINASGTHTYSHYFDLITGHNYTWTPYMRLSTASTTPTYGTPTFFFTGTNSSTPLPPSPYNPWASSTLISAPSLSTSTGIYSFSGTSTTSWTSGVLDAGTEALLATKAPFSYIYDLKTVFLELANGAATTSHSCINSDAYYTLPTGSMGSHLASGSTTIKIIDACAVAGFSTTQQIKTVIGYAIYLFTAIGLVGMAMSIF